MKNILILLAMLSITGCSNKNMYDQIQIRNRNTCMEAPPSQYDECIERTKKSYEEYERERDEVLKE